MSAIIGLSARFPALALKSVNEKALKNLGAEPARYMGMAVFVSSLAALVSLAGGAIAKSSLAIPFALSAFALSLGFFIALPGIELRRKASEIEAAMPFFLRGLGMLLEMGIPFQRAVSSACECGGVLEAEMRLALRAMEEGMPVQKALSSFASQFDSLAIKRALSQMIAVYETGASGAEMKKIGDELLSLEQHRMKEYAAKSAMFGLVFIITSAVLPTFFMMYSLAGGLLGWSTVSPQQVKLAMLVVFPLAGALVLLLSKAAMPRHGFQRESALELWALVPGGIFIFGYLVFPGLQAPAIVLGCAAGAFFAFSRYNQERRAEEIERHLPDALFSVAGLPGGSGAETVFRMMEEGGFGALSEEAGKSRRQLGMNVNYAAVLQDLAARNNSVMLRRACLMMRQMMDTGSLHRLNSLAEDMIRSAQAGRERSQLFALQKYTLVFGALLVPLILSMSLGLMADMGGIAGSGEAGAVVAAAASVVPPYLVIYAFSASLAISDAEGRKSAAAGYSAGLAAMSLAAFHFINL